MTAIFKLIKKNDSLYITKRVYDEDKVLFKVITKPFSNKISLVSIKDTNTICTSRVKKRFKLTYSIKSWESTIEVVKYNYFNFNLKFVMNDIEYKVKNYKNEIILMKDTDHIMTFEKMSPYTKQLGTFSFHKTEYDEEHLHIFLMCFLNIIYVFMMYNDAHTSAFNTALIGAAAGAAVGGAAGGGGC